MLRSLPCLLCSHWASAGSAVHQQCGTWRGAGPLELVTPPLLTVPLPVLPAFFHVPQGEPAPGRSVGDHGVDCLCMWVVSLAGSADRSVLRSGSDRRRTPGRRSSSSAPHRRQVLGVARPPAVKVVAGIGSPMLWGWGRCAARAVSPRVAGAAGPRGPRHSAGP